MAVQQHACGMGWGSMHEARPACAQMRRSTVIGASGNSVQDSIRTSHGAFLPRRHDSTVASIEDRLAAWTHLPMTHQEDLQASVQTLPLPLLHVFTVVLISLSIDCVGRSGEIVIGWQTLSPDALEGPMSMQCHGKSPFNKPLIASPGQGECSSSICRFASTMGRPAPL